MKRVWRFLCTRVVFLFFSSLIFAERITFSADSMSGRTVQGSDFTRLLGSATVITETMEIYADVIELSGTDFRYIKASGNVKGTNHESALDFTCQEMNYDRETKIASLESGVHLVDAENDVTAEAEMVEYNQESEVAVLQIAVRLTQKDNVCTGAYAIYHKNDQLLHLSGNPKVVQGSDSFRAQEITLHLDTQEIMLDGRVRGTVTTEEETAQQ